MQPGGDPRKPPISPRTLSMIFNSGSDFSKLLQSRDNGNFGTSSMMGNPTSSLQPSAAAAAAAAAAGLSGFSSAAAAAGFPGAGLSAAATTTTNPFESTDSTAAILRNADFLKSLDAYKESMSKAGQSQAANYNSDPAAFFRSTDFLKSLDNLPTERRKSVFKSMDFLQSLDYSSTDGQKLGRDIFASMDGKKFGKDIFSSIEGSQKKLSAAFATDVGTAAATAAHKKQLKDILSSRDWGREYNPTGSTFNKSLFESQDSVNSVSSVKSLSRMGKPLPPKKAGLVDFYNSQTVNSSDWTANYKPGHSDLSNYNRTIFRSEDSFKGEKPDPPAFGSSNSSAAGADRASSPTRTTTTTTSPTPAAKKPSSSASKWMKMYQAGLNNSAPPPSITIPPPVVGPSATTGVGGGFSAAAAAAAAAGLPAGLPTSISTSSAAAAGLPSSISIPPAVAARAAQMSRSMNMNMNMNAAAALAALPTKKPAPSAFPSAAAKAVTSSQPTQRFSPTPMSASTSPTPMDSAPADGEDGKPAADPTKKPKKKRIYKSRKVIPEIKTYVEYTDDDVLLGRGGLSNKHPGNKRYRQEIENAKAVYRAATKDEKTEWANLLVEYVKKYGGRFLEKDKDNGKWYIVPDVVARRKAGQALREENTPESRKEKRDRYKKAHGKL